MKGVKLVYKSIPALVLAIFAIKLLESAGGVALLAKVLTPVLSKVGLPSTAVLPLVTKYLAGGSAMTGVTLDFVTRGLLTATELNRVAGFMINPLDIVGFTVLTNAGPRVASVARPAILGGVAGIAARGIFHLLWF